jgi:hypothetical protein
VEELFLGALLAGQELDIVDQEEVDRAIALAELGGLVVADCRDQVVGELLARQVLDPEVRVAGGQTMTDGLEEMGLTETHAAIDEQRVVGLDRRFGDGEAGGLRELIRGAHDEGLEAIARIEVRRRCGRWRDRRRRRRGRAVDRQNQLGPGPGHRLGGRLERLEVPLLDLLAEKLIRNAEFQPAIAGVEHPEGADPGIEHLGRKLVF